MASAARWAPPSLPWSPIYFRRDTRRRPSRSPSSPESTECAWWPRSMVRRAAAIWRYLAGWCGRSAAMEGHDGTNARWPLARHSHGIRSGHSGRAWCARPARPPRFPVELEITENTEARQWAIYSSIRIACEIHVEKATCFADASEHTQDYQIDASDSRLANTIVGDALNGSGHTAIFHLHQKAALVVQMIGARFAFVLPCDDWLRNSFGLAHNLEYRTDLDLDAASRQGNYARRVCWRNFNRSVNLFVMCVRACVWCLRVSVNAAHR